MSLEAVYWCCEGSEDRAQHVLSAVPRGMGVQIPPKDPEAWRLFVHSEDVARVASGDARGFGGDNWL